MPKKKKKGKKAGKKKKKSKEELEKEEAERLAEEKRIAEEQRAARAAAKKKREEEHRLKRELAQKRRQEELKRLEAEEEALVFEDTEKQKALDAELAKLQKVVQWEAYLENDGTPNPSDEPQLNTMMSEWEENDDEDLKNNIAACTAAHKVLHRIAILIQQAVSQCDWQEVAKYMSYRLQLEEQITRKIDRSTSNILSNIEKFAAGKQNKQLSVGGDNFSLKFAMWMNIHAVGRYRPIEVEFEHVSMGLTIPKSLILNLLAARMLCFSYSHCSSLFTDRDVDELRDDDISELAAISHQRWRDKRKVVLPDGVIDDSPAYKPRMQTAADGTRLDVANTEFAKLPASLKKPFVEASTMTFKWKVAHERTVSLTSFGNTLVVELLGLPIVAKRLKRWTLQQITEQFNKKVQRLSYPLDGTNTTILQPIKVYFKLAETTLLRGTPRVGWWDSKAQDWTDDGITDVKVETVASGENGVLRFHTVHVGHFRMVQPRDLDIPYHYWEVKPHGGKGDLMLIIRTRHQDNNIQREVKIIATTGGCTLLAPTDLQLKPMIGKLMPARDVVARLTFSGICLCMSDEDATSVDGVGPKSRIVENRMHADISSMAFGFHVCKSKWNQLRGANETVFRIREQEVEHSFTVLCEHDAKSSRKFKCSLTKTKETSKKFHTTPIDGEMTHSRLWQLVRHRCTAETESMVQAGDVRVAENMRTLLDITRPCTFS